MGRHVRLNIFFSLIWNQFRYLGELLFFFGIWFNEYLNLGFLSQKCLFCLIYLWFIEVADVGITKVGCLPPLQECCQSMQFLSSWMKSDLEICEWLCSAFATWFCSWKWFGWEGGNGGEDKLELKSWKGFEHSVFIYA